MRRSVLTALLAMGCSPPPATIPSRAVDGGALGEISDLSGDLILQNMPQAIEAQRR